MINGKLQEFVCNVIAKGQMSFGDVRRLQRGCLPSGITNSEELEILLSLNANLVRADKAWAQWLVTAVVNFVATLGASEVPIEDAAGKRVECLLTASATKVSRQIARQIRRELTRSRVIRSPIGALESDLNARSFRKNPGSKPPYRHPGQSLAWSRPPRHTVRYEIPRAITLASAAHFGWQATLPAVQI